MSKIFIFLLILFTCLNYTLSQNNNIKVEYCVMPTINSFKINNNKAIINFKSGDNIEYNYGLLFQYPLNDRFFLNSGLKMSKFTISLFYKDNYIDFSYKKMDYLLKSYISNVYITLPMNLGYNLISKKKYNFNVVGGVNCIIYSVNQNENFYKSLNGDNYYNDVKNSSRFIFYPFGFNLSLKNEFLISKRIGLSFSPNINYYLSLKSEFTYYSFGFIFGFILN